MPWLSIPTSFPRTQGQYDPGSSHLWLGSESRVTVIHVKESFSQEIHTSTSSSLASLVSEISQGQQGFGVGIMPWQPELGLIFFKELTQRLLV